MLLRSSVRLWVIGMFTLYAHTANADVIDVVNAGFEDITGQNQSGEFTFGPPNGWDLYDPGGITGGGAGNTYFVGTLAPTAPTFFTNGAPEGTRVGIAFNFDGSGGQGEYGLQQTLSTSLAANSQYSLQVEIGNIASGSSQAGTFFNLDGFPGYRVDVLAGGVVMAQDNNTLSGAIAEGDFQTSHVSFQTGAVHPQLGQPLQIRLVNLNQVDLAFPNAELEVDFDDVRFNVTSVPEASGWLLAFAAAALQLTRRRRA